MRTPIFQNSNDNIASISALKVFIASLGLLGIFLGLPVTCRLPYLLYYLLSSGSPKKLPRRYKKFQGRNPYNIFVAILENRCLRKSILSLTEIDRNTTWTNERFQQNYCESFFYFKRVLVVYILLDMIIFTRRSFDKFTQLTDFVLFYGM